MNKTLTKLTCYAAITTILAGCATAGKDVAATYVSPIQFSNYDCDQLRQELVRINGRVGQLTGRLDEAASNDKAIATASILFFPLALFAVGGTKQQEAELSRLKGEYDALQTASAGKKCS
jgi:outer membrane murein-binding lipoprotein Lpp